MAGGLNLDELRERIAALHGSRVAQHATDVALLWAARAVYLAAGQRRLAAEDALLAAMKAHEDAKETEHEWQAIVHGLSLVVARSLDAKSRRRDVT
jgi:hypothetical protein